MYSHYFTCGPFASASFSAADLGTGIYSSFLLSQSMASHTDHQIKLQQAIEEQADAEQIATLQRELDYYNNLLDITLTAVTLVDEIEQ